MKRSIKIQLTDDGSPTLYFSELDEHYHSTKGAITEACHVYRDCGLRYCNKSAVRVLEIGFGTGLNALITALCVEKDIEYYTLELYPLESDIMQAAHYGNAELHQLIADAPWNQLTPITNHFSINKIITDFTDTSISLPQGIDVVYYDAFAPEKQPEMWSIDCFRRVFDAMNRGGILTTYCAKGVIRRRLQEAGFTVERLAGPPGGKREILRATKPI